jgi:hypothetical protein
MKRWLPGLWLVISRPLGEEDFDSANASSQFDASTCIRHGYLHPELLQLLQLLTP